MILVGSWILFLVVFLFLIVYYLYDVLACLLGK